MAVSARRHRRWHPIAQDRSSKIAPARPHQQHRTTRTHDRYRHQSVEGSPPLKQVASAAAAFGWAMPRWQCKSATRPLHIRPAWRTMAVLLLSCISVKVSQSFTPRRSPDAKTHNDFDCGGVRARRHGRAGQCAKPAARSRRFHALKNATPIVTLAACNGRTGGCGCGPGWITSCPGGCCRCVPCY